MLLIIQFFFFVVALNQVKHFHSFHHHYSKSNPCTASLLQRRLLETEATNARRFRSACKKGGKEKERYAFLFVAGFFAERMCVCVCAFFMSFSAFWRVQISTRPGYAASSVVASAHACFFRRIRGTKTEVCKTRRRETAFKTCVDKEQKKNTVTCL